MSGHYQVDQLRMRVFIRQASPTRCDEIVEYANIS